MKKCFEFLFFASLFIAAWWLFLAGETDRYCLTMFIMVIVGATLNLMLNADKSVEFPILKSAVLCLFIMGMLNFWGARLLFIRWLLFSVSLLIQTSWIKPKDYDENGKWHGAILCISLMGCVLFLNFVNSSKEKLNSLSEDMVIEEVDQEKTEKHAGFEVPDWDKQFV